MKLYKVLIETSRGVRSLYRDYTKFLPINDEPGEWLPWIDNPKVYSEGYHLTDTPTRHGLPGDVVFEAEGIGFGGCAKDEYTYATIRLIRRMPVKYDHIGEESRLLKAVRAVYYYGHWTTNKSAFASSPIEEQLWTELRDAAGFEPGKSPK